MTSDANTTTRPPPRNTNCPRAHTALTLSLVECTSGFSAGWRVNAAQGWGKRGVTRQELRRACVCS